MSEEKKKLFYTKIFEKCSPKSNDEFEECCKDEADNILTKVESFSKIMDKTTDRFEKVFKKTINEDDHSGREE